MSEEPAMPRKQEPYSYGDLVCDLLLERCRSRGSGRIASVTLWLSKYPLQGVENRKIRSISV